MTKKIISIGTLLLFILVFTGCNPKYGYVNLQTWNGISIYVDEEYKGDAGEGITKLKIEEGNHIIKVSGDSKDGDWHYEIEKNIYVGADMEITVSLIPKQFPTEQKKNKDRIEQERLKEQQLKEAQRIEKIKQEKLKQAQKYGCSSIDEYHKYIKLNENIEEYKRSLNDIYKLKKEIVKENGYMVPNDYMELSDYKINDKTLTINIKNKTKHTITYFWSYFSFADEKLNYIGGDKQYKEYIKIKPHKNQKFNIRISSHIYRKMVKAKKIYLFMDVDKIRYRDKIGKVSKNLDDKGWHFNNKINKVSDESIFKFNQKIKQQEKELSKICKKN